MEEPSSKSSSSSTNWNMDELPYFTEKYPGKFCCLCNLSEKSALGQGDMLRIPVNAQTLKSLISALDATKTADASDVASAEESPSRKKAVVKPKVTINNELINELDVVGSEEIPTLEETITATDGCFLYIHTKCAMWCLQLKRVEEEATTNFEEMVVKSLQRKCSYCLRYGASINCRMSCPKNFHLPCAAAAGCFLIIESFQAFCVEHVSQVPFIAVDTNIECRQCFGLGDISKLLMCSTCGAHYHNYCVGLANFPDSRSGWNCQQCCKCLICRQSDSGENRSVKCEQCQKLYHTNCLRPIISSVPKYGWKCNRCRVCTDCGSRTPGAGSSSRWHCHYTICDSCYQQRNKGFSCPICHKAYRAASHKEMVKCSNCNRFVHSGCDGEADLSAYHVKKESNPDYDYICPPCKSGKHIMGFGALDPILGSADGFPRDLESEFYDKDALEITNAVDPLKISKKRLNLKDFGRGGKVGRLYMGKGGLLSQINRKRSARGKGRPLPMLSASSMQSNSNNDHSNTQCSEDDMSLEKKIILCSAKDKFILMQDICVMCGALGTDQEACLISCAQCGQCYHPYCANVTLSKTMLQKGWRCLDCTVCEGCGQKNDESRLLLCDECDISYHIYCMNPPLDAVPNGNWKCNLCAVCHKCGRNSPGKNSQWFNGFLECGPCASQAKCFVCSQAYNENELIIQCNNCERWSHGMCDNIKTEEDLLKEVEYHCKACRKEDKPSKAVANKSESANASHKATPTTPQQSANQESSANNSNATAASVATPSESFENTDNTFWIDGVCVSEHGFNMIRTLTTEIKKKRKLKSDINQKDAGIMSAIDSVVAGNANAGEGNAAVDGNTTPTYKDGMVWLGEDGSQPEGFSISTNEEGVNILRKKRQRNLQKLGIGGFNVRMRGIRKENEDIYMGTLENPSLTDEKKKKIIKKKLKSKICESYPSYLQEAFFGKSLLENKSSVDFGDESNSSDDCGITMETQSYLLQQARSSVETAASANDGTSANTSMAAPTLDVVKNEVNVKQESACMQSNTNNNDLLAANSCQVDEKQLNAMISENNIMNETCGMSSNSEMMDINSIKMEIGQQCNNVPMVQTNPVVIQANPPQQLSQQSFLQGNVSNTNNMNVNSGGVQKMQHQQQQILQQPQQHQTQQQHILTYQTSYDPMAMQSTTNKNPAQYLTQKSEDPMLSQIKIERDIMLSQVVNVNEQMAPDTAVDVPMPIEEPAKEAVVAGTQKTAEKMRKDEDLGEMATISAVLYANTQHPELKHLYPNWNERCKQILKKWRSLSTEMKAPFLQQAKDNRSVLRLRRTQQEPEKLYFQQKSLKEQEQERVWKQHQAKNKETYGNKFNKNAFVGDYNRTEPQPQPAVINQKLQQQQQQPQSMYDLNMLSGDHSKNKLSKQPHHSTEQQQMNPMSISECSQPTLSQIMPPQQDQQPPQQQQQQQEPPRTQFVANFNPQMHSHSNTAMQQQHTNASTMDELSKAYGSNKSDAASQLCERNDIFLTDKNWPGVSKLGDPKDNVAVDKLEADETGAFGDILGGFGEGDDDEILKSLTAEIGDDFNILEYADPELDEINGSQNLLNKLDFDESQKPI
ncbi:histone-lysine N-methyltransferase 2C isoform X2 [Musca domestica]|uniref:Histone-lysine N-methyltransferase 2C isoform X2 n=1 Tax=Musca domestica TaxID=7370 RepID=A0ABM3UUP6_MUSDO|nr:histone-lysine N-methyltransferase 2C isoform X2 [Musca domestica]